jgi:hypothetical protein
MNSPLPVTVKRDRVTFVGFLPLLRAARAATLIGMWLGDSVLGFQQVLSCCHIPCA